MKPGDNVVLTEDMEELRAGMKGVVVVGKEHISESGMPTPYVCTGLTANTIAVHFEGRASYSIGRRVDGKYVKVIDKCNLMSDAKN